MSLNHSPSQRPEQIPTQLAVDFEYGKLDRGTRMVVQQRTCEIKSLMRRTAQDIIDIGQKLIEVRKHLGYGKFRKWLKAEFEWSASAATKFIQVAERFSCVKFTQLKIAVSALYLLAKPSTQNQARQEALDRASQGETITHAVEIISRHRTDTAYMPEQTTITVTAEALEQQSSPPTKPPLAPEASTSAKLLNEFTWHTEVMSQDVNSVHVSGPDGSRLGDICKIVYKMGCVRSLQGHDDEDRWTSSTANSSKVIADKKLLVDVEEHDGVKLTRKSDWVELVEPEAFEEQPQAKHAEVEFPHKPHFLSR